MRVLDPYKYVIADVTIDINVEVTSIETYFILKRSLD